MPHRRLVIGDVHGHYESLVTLLELIAPTSDEPIYFLGDLIDRGPDSAKVVELVKTHKYHCLLGNHEQMLLEAIGKQGIATELFQAWLQCGGKATLDSYQLRIPQDHIEWMKTLPWYLDLGDVWLVHAGVHPDMSLAEQTPDQFCWIRDQFHSCPHPYFQDKLIIVGHTITFTFPGVQPGDLVAGMGWLNIDTGAYHPRSGWLTALDITTQTVYQVNSQRRTYRSLPLEEVVVPIDPTVVSRRRIRQPI